MWTYVYFTFNRNQERFSMDQLGIPNIFTSTFNRLKINQNYLDLVVICNYVMYVIFLSKLITMHVVGILYTRYNSFIIQSYQRTYDTHMRNLSLFLYLLTQLIYPTVLICMYCNPNNSEILTNQDILKIHLFSVSTIE